MFRFATLKAAISAEDKVQSVAGVLKAAEVDILCCQEKFGSAAGDYQVTSKMAELLGMSYSFSISRPEGKRDAGEGQDEACGLAILTGSQAWMLNSGSFSLSSEEGKPGKIVQFAVIRKLGNTILVLNMSFSPSPQLQDQQLQAVMSNSLFRDQYGAIILCCEMHQRVAEHRVRNCMSGSRLKSQYDLTVIGSSESGTGATAGETDGPGNRNIWSPILLFTKRDKPLARVEVGNSRDLLLTEKEKASGRRLGFTTDITLTRLPLEKKNGRYRLLSFREQWNTRERELALANRVAAGY